MKLVIDIDEKDYNKLSYENKEEIIAFNCSLREIIADDTPLPKDIYLIDKNKALSSILKYFAIKRSWEQLKETLTEMRENSADETVRNISNFLINYIDMLEKEEWWE